MFVTRCMALAKRQHNVFGQGQLEETGVTPRTIRRRLAAGDLIALHPRVFTLPGLTLTWKSHLFAACLWSVDGLASHRSAAAVYGLRGFEARWRPEIVVPRCHLPPRSGVIVHHTDRLPRIDREKQYGIRVTSVERTLLDLGAVCPWNRVAVALDDALHRKLTDLAALDACLQRTARRGRRGCRPLRELIKERVRTERFNTSALETLFFEAAIAHALPAPVPQYEVRRDGHFVARVDFAWPERRVAVEVDGYEHHGGRDAFERDRARLSELAALGWMVIPGTWRQLDESPQTLMDRAWRAWVQRENVTEPDRSGLGPGLRAREPGDATGPGPASMSSR